MISRRNLISILVVLAGIAAGYFIAGAVTDFLAIDIREKELPEVDLTGDSTSVRTATGAALPLRMADMGGVGILPDTANWGSNYEHNQHVFEDVILVNPPFVDTSAFSREQRKMEQYAGMMAEYGFNAISLPWFLEVVNFDRVGDGHQVYGNQSLYRQRHDTLALWIGQLMEVTSERGLGPYLWTDMVALTPPLRSYFQRRFGSVDTGREEFWDVYRLAAEEAFEKFPLVEGIIIRIGEAGSIYNKPGWEYTSELYVRTERSVRLMLDAFLAAAEKYDRTIIFRTWSVGIGNIGDMHTNPETYHRVLDEIRSYHLVVSTKYCSGDFYSWLPLNPTLFTGSHRRITELQTKREFEGFGAIPNYVAPLHRDALRAFVEGNPRFEGAWTWTQNGGPLRAGPLIIYPFYGFNVINDANVYATGRLLNDPRQSMDSISAEWIGMTFGTDSLLTANLLQFLNSSHEVMRRGLYISEFARFDVRALGLEPPPMLWIFEWDILGASTSVFSNIYLVTRDRFREVIDEGFEAVRGAVALKELLLAAVPRVEYNLDEYRALTDAVTYEIELFRLLDYYRQFFMNYYRWIDTGDQQALTAWKLSLGQFRAVMDDHAGKFSDDLNTLGMDLEEVEKGIGVAGRTTGVIRWSRGIMAVIFFLLILGIPGFVRDRAHMRFSGTLLFDALFRPFRITRLQAYHGTGLLVFIAVILYVLALAVFTGFGSLLFPLVLGGLGLFPVILLGPLFNRDRDFGKILVTLMAPRLSIIFFLMVFTAIRGPFYFWYHLWTSDLFRLLFFTVFLMLVFRKFQVTIIVGQKLGDRSITGSAALVFLVLALQLLAAGLIMHLAGLEESLTALNNELLVLPGGLSKILGITTHLGIPPQLPLWLIWFAATLGGISFLIFLFNRKRI